MKKFRLSAVAAFLGCMILVASPLPASGADEAPVDEDPPSEIASTLDVTSDDVYTLAYSDPRATVGSYDELEAAAVLVGAELQTVIFEGDTGVGQLAVADEDTAETVASRASQIFADADTATPPITGGLVTTKQSVPDEVVIGDATLTLSQEAVTGTSPISSVALPPAGGSRFRTWEGYQPIKGWPGYNAVNEWAEYFPFTYRYEAFNLNRCTRLVSGVCQATAPWAKLIQTIEWTGGSHNYYWPDEAEWGFEFGSAMYNYSLCGPVGSTSPGWWLNPVYTDWATNVPIDAQPYQDVNREFDTCGTTTHELGIRYPSFLIAGAEYSYVVSAARNVYRSSSTVSAAFQAVHNDCPPGTARDWLTHCMGLNEFIAFPHGQQSATVINVSRNFVMPGCARMYAGWERPLQWFNGHSKEVPVAMDAFWDPPNASFFDNCFYNDW